MSSSKHEVTKGAPESNAEEEKPTGTCACGHDHERDHVSGRWFCTICSKWCKKPPRKSQTGTLRIVKRDGFAPYLIYEGPNANKLLQRAARLGDTLEVEVTPLE